MHVELSFLGSFHRFQISLLLKLIWNISKGFSMQLDSLPFSGLGYSLLMHL